ncbi:unnamed protein product [Caenorhabditis sp. 36 PRJEB53466]|nr:unnamed protein product [Caenorhabditis sp. 36 PRJEB53466]
MRSKRLEMDFDRNGRGLSGNLDPLNSLRVPVDECNEDLVLSPAQFITFFCVLILEGAFFVVRTVFFLTAKNPALSEKTREMQKRILGKKTSTTVTPTDISVTPKQSKVDIRRVTTMSIQN